MVYKDRNKKIEYNKNYYRNNKEKLKAKMKEYYDKNKEKLNTQSRQFNKEYYRKYKEIINKKHRIYYCNNKNKVYEKQKEYRRNNKDIVKQRRRKNYLNSAYGLSTTELDNLLLAQNNRCAICNEPLDLQNSKNVHIDHDHKTGKIRGILCQKCNLAIGLLRDNPEYTKRATEYLERNNNEK